MENQENSEDIKKKADQYLNNWKRAAADFINYKKDEVERAGLLVGYAKEDMFFNLLPIIDSIYLAAAAFGKEGFEPVEKQIQEFLKKEGIEEITAIDQKFNPETMEIVEEVDNKDSGFKIQESGMVVEELQKGYSMNGKVVRPTKVKIIK